MPTVYLSLGSNIGDRQGFLQRAIAKLKQKVDILDVSTFYLTDPWGNEDQPSFINICAKGKTSLAPKELLGFIKSIEADLGRSQTKKWGPREIDIDILLYDDKNIDSEALKIPHPYLTKRAFVLMPLAEIAPELIHPLLKKSVAELAYSIDKKGVKRLTSNE